MTRPKRYPGQEVQAERQRREKDEQRATRVAGGVVLGALAVLILAPLVAFAAGWLR